MHRNGRVLGALVATLALVFAMTLSNTASATSPSAVAPAQAASAPYVMPGQTTMVANGVSMMVPTGYVSNGDYWYTFWMIVSGSAVYMGANRLSWSHQWQIKNGGWKGSAALATILCGFIPSSAGKTACALYVSAVGYSVYSSVSSAIANRKCMTFRFALPPHPWYKGAARWQATCTR